MKSNEEKIISSGDPDFDALCNKWRGARKEWRESLNGKNENSSEAFSKWVKTHNELMRGL